MFNMIMTYHQIMPAFLDFAFSFGDQEYQKDFNFSAIRLEENLGSTYLANEIPILKRSDRGFQLCYNLRSVEKVSVPEEWPWSIRQTATASQFDTQTHLSSWIVLKANSRLRRKIQTEASSDRFTDSHGFDTVQGSFAAYSLTHIMVCEWARGHWAQYITFLEKNMQEQTRHLTLQDVDKKTIRMPAIRRLERSRSTPAHAIRRRTTLVDNARQHIRQALTWMPSVAASTRHSGTELDRVAPATSAPSDEQEDRLFESLQDVHMLEEKANEALLIVRSNMSVMNELADHIGNMSKQAKFPEAIRADKCNLVPRLQNQIRGIVSDLKLQEARTENLLQLLGNRKAMVRLCVRACLSKDAD